MRKIFGLVVLGLGASMVAVATPTAPEIDPGTSMTAISLLSGALLVLRGSRK